MQLAGLCGVDLGGRGFGLVVDKCDTGVVHFIRRSIGHVPRIRLGTSGLDVSHAHDVLPSLPCRRPEPWQPRGRRRSRGSRGVRFGCCPHPCLTRQTRRRVVHRRGRARRGSTKAPTPTAGRGLASGGCCGLVATSTGRGGVPGAGARTGGGGWHRRGLTRCGRSNGMGRRVLLQRRAWWRPPLLVVQQRVLLALHARAVVGRGRAPVVQRCHRSGIVVHLPCCVLGSLCAHAKVPDHSCLVGSAGEWRGLQPETSRVWRPALHHNNRRPHAGQRNGELGGAHI